jgi:hypothetical protein
MPRIDITNPARSSESLLVIDDRYNTLIITHALLQLAPVMHSKLADALNRTLGTQFTCFTSTTVRILTQNALLGGVLTASSERVLARLLACASEPAMCDTLAHMHEGRQDNDDLRLRRMLTSASSRHAK